MYQAASCAKRGPVAFSSDGLGPLVSMNESAQFSSEFRTTRWSQVARAGEGESPTQESALAYLCEQYWFPLHNHVCRRGADPESARDLTQAFFADLLKRNSIVEAEAARGRFRNFLVRSLENFLNHQRSHSLAWKRGGRNPHVSLDETRVDGSSWEPPASSSSPDHEFDRQWARTLIDHVMQRLAKEFEANGRIELFELLRPHLFREAGGVPYVEIAIQLNLTVVAIKATVHRLRKRFGELLRAEIRRTVQSSGDVEAELSDLFQILSQ